ncbi:MAG: LEPR-XLL domain-containing protein [Planctomycetes bacterium]|nr:LEPR-XLL domain-containing protein [Planctomycetota bacterium]
MKHCIADRFRALVSAGSSSFRCRNRTRGYVPRFEQLEPRFLLSTTTLSSYSTTAPIGVEVEAVQSSYAGDSIAAIQSIVAWEFDSLGDQEGWFNNPGATNNGVDGGSWNLVMSGTDPSLFGPGIGVVSSDSTIVEITMSSNDANVASQLFWKVSGDASFSEQRSVVFTLINDGAPHIYQIQLANDPDWTGTITQLRLDPVGVSNGGSVSIDSIRLLSTTISTTTAIGIGGDWHDPNTWSNGVPDQFTEVVIPSGTAVQMSGADHDSKSLLVEGTLLAVESGITNKTLTADWILVNGGSFNIGSSANPYDTHTFTVTLEGDNPSQDLPSLGISSNDAFLMVRNSGTLSLFGGVETSWTQLGTTASVGESSITLKEPVTWDIGDEIVIASTTFDMNEAETRTITNVVGQTVFLDAPLTYTHYGELQNYDNGKGTVYELDERAEVGLLSRSIKIQGDADSTTDGIGGHLMFMPSSGAIQIDGAELYHMGQKSRVARYPVHWHLAGDRTGDYVKNTSIHRSFNRAVVIHATHNVLVEQTVAYDHIGSGYFLENAVETGNKFYYNLGLVTREPVVGEEILPTDLGPKQFQISGPGTFWITNPDNEFVGNVAAGSQDGSGFWYAFPSRPLNQSTNDPQYAGVRPRNIALGLFQDNRAHSNAIGLDVDGGPNVVTEVAESSHYRPPTDANFSGFTAFANSINGVYFRGTSRLKLPNARLADNFQATMFAFGQTISDSLIVGVSENDFGGGLKRGFTVYDGPNIVRNVHFAGFNNPNAQIFSIIGAASRHANHIFEEITFDDPATPFKFPDSVQNRTLSRHWGFSLYDADGTFTGVAGKSIVFDHPMMRSDGDILLPTWQKAVVSQRKFGHLRLDHGLSAASQPTTTITRTGGPGTDASHTDIPLHEAFTQIGVVMNTDFVYTVNYDTTLSSIKIDMKLGDVHAGDFVYIRIVNPWANQQVTGIPAKNSEQEVRDSSTSAFYVNPNGHAFVKAVVQPDSTSLLIKVRKLLFPPNLPSPSGDFNADGNVGGADFLAWQRGFGKPLAFEIEGDANGDFDVDATDLNTWKNQFGSVGGSVVTSSTVSDSSLLNAFSTASITPVVLEPITQPLLLTASLVDAAQSMNMGIQTSTGHFFEFAFEEGDLIRENRIASVLELDDTTRSASSSATAVPNGKLATQAEETEEDRFKAAALDEVFANVFG